MYPNKKTDERNKSQNFVSRNKKEEIEEVRKKLIEKLAVTIKMKNSKMFKEINYDIRALILDLNEIVKVTELPFEAYLIKIEKSILDKITKKEKITESIASKIVIDMKKINSLIKEPLVNLNKNQIQSKITKKAKYLNKKNSRSAKNIKEKENSNKNIDGENNVKTMVNSNIDDIIHISERQSLILDENKIKKEDEWAKLANHNYNKFQEELIKIKQKEEEKKKVLRENLTKQILEKQSIVLREKEYDQNYHTLHKEILSRQDFSEKKKIEDTLTKIKTEKEIRDRIVVDSKKTKKKEEETVVKEDKNFLERIKNDMMTEEEKINKKKEGEKEMYKRLIVENEHRLKLKREEKVKEKSDNIKALDEYSKLIEKQEIDRIAQKQNRLDRVKNLMDKFGEAIKVDETSNKLREDRRFLKEIEEKERRQIESEKVQRDKKKMLYNDMKHTLDVQVNDRKILDIETKSKDKQFSNEISSQISKFNSEKNEKVIGEKEKMKKYKEELVNQVVEKARFKVPSMDEKERLMNRIDEINAKN